MFKRILTILALFIGTTSFAEVKNTDFSVSAGFGAIGKELGYGLFVGSPYWNDGRTNLQLGFRQNQIFGIQNGKSSETPFVYSVLDLTVVNRIFRTESIALSGNISTLFGLPSDLRSSLASAMKFSFSGEYSPENSFYTFFTEIGASLPLNTTADGLVGGPQLLSGGTILIGVKKYLF